MRKTIFSLLAITILGLSVQAQDYSYKVEQNLVSKKICTVNWSELPEVNAKVEPVHFYPPEPAQNADAAKQALDSKRKRRFVQGSLDKYKQSSGDITPPLENDYNGLPIGGGGNPNDNNMAISNEGFVVSVINSTVSMFDNQDNFLGLKSLRAFVSGALPNLNRTYDPKICFDPINEKFILVFLQGSLSADTRIVVGFSESQDPTGNWNFYALNGNPFNGKTWSDYPIIGMNKDDFFVTVNILNDGESWQEGFQESVIWQVDKASGFSGNDSLYQNLVHDIKFEGKSIWSICAVQSAPELESGLMNFLSVRPGDLKNDTLFVHTLKGIQRNGSPEYSLSVHKTEKPYGVPPSAFQPEIGYKLQTNDTRVLSAIKVKGEIQYVQTTNIEGHDPSAVFHGILNLSNGILTSHYIQSDTFDYAYPSIAYAGSESRPFASVITFSHSSELFYPGTSAIFHNKLKGRESIYSYPVVIKEGEGLINTPFPDSSERWGDYTGIQTKYNESGVVWMCGSYGNATNRVGVWIGKLRVNNELQVELDENSIKVYPNPIGSQSTVQIKLEKDANVSIQLISAEGKIVRILKEGVLESGEHLLSFDSGGMRPGIYLVNLISLDDNESLGSYRVLID